MSMSEHVQHSFALVIPAYNRAHLISETIESALNQEKPFTEIIVVDDGSTDDTRAVLEKFGSRIRVIHTANGGVQAARNLGISSASSDYVTLCDSDDLLEPEFLKVFSKWLASHPDCDVLYSNFVSFKNKTVFPDRLSYAPAGLYADLEAQGDFATAMPALIARIVKFQILFVTGMTLKRSMFDVIGKYDTAFNRVGAEDFEFTLRAVSRANIAFCRRPLARVRRHDGNDSSDQVRHIVGEIRILEHAMDREPEVAKQRRTIHAGLDERCLYVFDAAFARGDFDLAFQMLRKFREEPRSLRFRIKKTILKFPQPCRSAFWRLTQR